MGKMRIEREKRHKFGKTDGVVEHREDNNKNNNHNYNHNNEPTATTIVQFSTGNLVHVDIAYDI